MSAPIKVRHLDHWFGAGEARKQAIFDVSLSIGPGSLTILIGPSARARLPFSP